MEQYEQYFKQIENIKRTENQRNHLIQICDECNVRMLVNGHYYVCKSCGRVRNSSRLILSNSLSFKDKKNYQIHYKTYYKRINQFSKYLEKTDMPFSLKLRLKNMFRKIEVEFYKYTKRRNFIQYEYIVIKMLEIVNQRQYIEKYKFPKSKLTLYKYDMIWKKICKALHWKFINSTCILCVINKMF